MDFIADNEILVVILLVFALFILIVGLSRLLVTFRIELPEKRAGRIGEKFAKRIISEILYDDEVLLTNVHIIAEGKEAEIDDVIINDKGVFIIEVKNYSGQLIGEEDDFEWVKNKITEAGNLYQSTVKNPIKQVKRQEYLLSRFLRDHGVKVWIKGYAFLVERNSPVKSSYILDTQKDIDAVLHSESENHLDEETIGRIVELLTDEFKPANNYGLTGDMGL